jgi:hypothetical protein
MTSPFKESHTSARQATELAESIEELSIAELSSVSAGNRNLVLRVVGFTAKGRAVRAWAKP